MSDTHAAAEGDVTVVIPPAEGETQQTERQRDPDTGQFVAKTEPKKPESKEPAADLAEQFKAVQKSHELEKSRRVEVERQIAEERKRVARVEQERDAARQGMATREMDALNAGISAAETERLAAKAALKAAFEAGDPEAMAEAQARISEAVSRKLRFDEARQDLEARQPEPERRQEREQPTDQFEAYLAQFSPKTAGWLREHRDWVSDGKKNAKLQAAHYDAVANDIQPDTEEYFEHVERVIGLREAEPEPAPKTNGAAKPTARKGPPAAPPVSGGGRGGGGNGGGETVSLSKGEATAATDGTHVWLPADLANGRIKDKSLLGQPIGTQEFARRKLALTKQGAYDRSYTEQ